MSLYSWANIWWLVQPKTQYGVKTSHPVAKKSNSCHVHIVCESDFVPEITARLFKHLFEISVDK